jgi:hypothetical protein
MDMYPKWFFQYQRKEYNMDDQNRILAGLILNCKPEDLKGVAQKADGSLAVVAPNGMKFVFSPVELENARDSFCLPAVPMAEPVEAIERGMPVPPTSIPARQKTPCGTGAGTSDGNPMIVKANGYSVSVPPTSTGSVSGSGSVSGTSSTTATTHRRRKGARP